MARANIELDSFYVKFKTLLHAGKDATLSMKSDAGKAIVTLSLDLGQFSLPDQYPPRPRDGPARRQRRERRAAARAEEVRATRVTLDNTSFTEKVENVAVAKANETGNMDAIVAVESHENHGKTTEKVVNPPEKNQVDAEEVISADKSSYIVETEWESHETENAVTATDKSSCIICDFSSKSKNGLATHMTRKHSSIEQLDGNIDIESEVLEKNDLVKIEGEYKNPSFRAWSRVDPEGEVKVLWEKLKNMGKVEGIEEIGEGSTCFEHHFEFWGTWRVKKEGITEEFLKNNRNWPKGVKITNVKTA